MTTQFIGTEGFRWFFGVVEDRDDPLQLGRCRVRIKTIHDTEGAYKIPTQDLPWAVPLMPLISASSKQIGLAPVGPIIGSTVFGFFMDGSESQIPVIMGSLAGIPDKDYKKHDVKDLARGFSTLNKQLVGPEPAPSYRAKYPFNKVFSSEAGHVVEIDDTPNAERVHLYHKSGSYTEINEQGNVTHKIVGDGFEIVVRNKTLYVQGNVNITVGGDASIDVSGSTNIKVGGSTTLTSSGVTVNSDTRINGILTVKKLVTDTGDIVAENGSFTATNINATNIQASTIQTGSINSDSHSH